MQRTFTTKVWWPEYAGYGGTHTYCAFKEAWKAVVWYLESGYGIAGESEICLGHRVKNTIETRKLISTTN